MEELGKFVWKYVSAAGACLYLFTFGIFRARNRPFLGTICAHFSLGRKGRLPAVRVDEAAPQGAVVISDLSPDVGHISLKESIVLMRIVKARRPKRIFEFGTFDGRTTLDMALNTDAEARVYTLDLPVGSEVFQMAMPHAPTEGGLIRSRPAKRRFEGLPEEKKVVALTGDSATFDYAPYEGSIDLVFVDGSHSFEYAISDSRKAATLVKSGGIIVWHDYGPRGWAGVTRALELLSSDGGFFAGIRSIAGTTLAVLECKGNG